MVDGWRLDQIHMSWTKIGTACLGTELGLNINAFLEQYSFKERILVAKHQTLVCCMSVSSLEIGQVLLMGTNSFLELLDVLGPPLSECRLCLAVSLLSLFRCSIYLDVASCQSWCITALSQKAKWRSSLF